MTTWKAVEWKHHKINNENHEKYIGNKFFQSVCQTKWLQHPSQLFLLLSFKTQLCLLTNVSNEKRVAYRVSKKLKLIICRTNFHKRSYWKSYNESCRRDYPCPGKQLVWKIQGKFSSWSCMTKALSRPCLFFVIL